jgi:hypothetical protein
MNLYKSVAYLLTDLDQMFPLPSKTILLFGDFNYMVVYMLYFPSNPLDQ